MFVMPGVLIMTTELIMPRVLIVTTVMLVIVVVRVLGYDLTNRSMARVASAIIWSAVAVSPATDASLTQ